MGFLSEIEKYFDRREIKEGRIYRVSGRVRNLTVAGQLAVADVFGSDRYKTRLDWSREKQGELHCDCTCPDFQAAGICGHVYALCAELAHQGKGPQGDQPLALFEMASSEGGSAQAVAPLESPLMPSAPMSGKDLLAAAFSAGLSGFQPTYGFPGPSGGSHHASRAAQAARRTVVPAWQQRLAPLQGPGDSLYLASPQAQPPRAREILFLVDAEQYDENGLTLSVYCREEKKSGGFGKLKEFRVGSDMLDEVADAADRETLALLIGGGTTRSSSYYGYYSPEKQSSRYVLNPAMYDTLLSRLTQRRQLRWLPLKKRDPSDSRPLTWGGGERFVYKTVIEPHAGGWQVSGVFVRDGERRPADASVLLLPDNLAIFDDRLVQCRLVQGSDLDWMEHFRQQGPLQLSAAEAAPFRQWLHKFSAVPTIDAPPEFHWQERVGTPACRITFTPRKYRADLLDGAVSFDYEGQTVSQNKGGPGHFTDSAGVILRRNFEEERRRLGELENVGVAIRDHGFQYRSQMDFELPAKRLGEAVPELMALGWKVEAEGIKYRSPGDFQASLVSGIDWFDLEGSFDFEGVSVQLPALLAAVRKGQKFVELGDGTQGVLPADWLARYGRLLDLGDEVEGKVRFRSSQALLLDALLAAQPQVELDERFREVKGRLVRFEGIAPRQEPASFRGELRPYQREGLGWLAFLEEFRLGGCLADDMGLGKTIQVLAHLEARRVARGRGERRPSLVVVPKSLVHNWKNEAARFTPELKVLDYTGTERKNASKGLEEFDLVVTTYGTIRNDVVKLKEIEFDYVILDEAQAIKNSSAQAAKAVRLLQGRHRLAMSGTPIENHLGELWSLFEFLNPGMLGRAEAFKRIIGGTKDGDARERLGLLARALRPYFLRRTKDAVLAELPEKTEQTLLCELGAEERKLYDELRDHYRAALENRIATEGLAKSKIHVLEALLRLRQAACHPGLLDPDRANGGSAKVDLLLEQLQEVIDEGHKALVFSQFTSLLALVEKRLTAEKIRYAYLDGQTNNRGEVVEQFQSDAECPVFLLSLKAGGVGLNLTAADYVFILDPWWNPAVEAQAIDRAHRIGQTQHVFAYRLIAKGTVEEKIVALQKDKRDLAEAILSADNSLIGSLTAEDLELLLG